MRANWKNVGMKSLANFEHRKACNLVLSGILKTVAAGLFLVVLLPDGIGWRPFCALVFAIDCGMCAIKFRVDGKE